MFRTMQKTLGYPTIRCLAFYTARLVHMRHGTRYKENYYDILKIPINSNNQEIKRAFIELSKKYHPDANSKTPNSEEFVRICEAYQVLHKESLRSQYDSRIRKMGQPAVDTSYSMANVHKNWQQYQTAMRKKQQGYSLKINRSSGGKRENGPWAVKTNRVSRWLPALTPSIGLGVNESHRQNFCGSAAFSDTGGNDEEIESPTEWMYSCYIAGFGLVSGLLFMDSVSDWCDQEPSGCPERLAL